MQSKASLITILILVGALLFALALPVQLSEGTVILDGNRIRVYEGQDIQTAINDISATGKRGTVELMSSSFTLPAGLIAKSNVDLQGNNATITLGIPDDVPTVEFNNVSNTVWQNVRLFRNGFTNNGADVVRFRGTIDSSVQVRNFFIQNDIIDRGTITSGRVAVAFLDYASPHLFDGTIISSVTRHTHATYAGGWGDQSASPKPVLTNVTSISRGNAANNNSGYDVDSYAHLTLINSSGYASTTADGEGLNVRYNGSVTVYGGEYQGNSGISAGGASSGTVIGAKTIGRLDGGIHTSGATTIRFIGGSSSGNPYGESPSMRVEEGSSASFAGLDVSPVRFSKWWSYNTAGQFRPFETHPYMLTGLYFIINTAYPNQTLDIGTTPGGHEVVDNITLNEASIAYFFAYNRVEVPAGGYLYATPSVPIANDDVWIYYNVITNYPNSPAVWLKTVGSANIFSSVLQSNGASDAFWIEADSANNWHASKNVIETLDPINRYAINAPYPLTVQPFYDNVLRGRISPNVIIP